MCTDPSARASASAIVGPIGACFRNGNSYVADNFFAAPARAGATSPAVLSPLLTGVVFQSALSLIYRKRFALPGKPFHSVHFVALATWRTALIASHSVGATTPTRLPFTITCAFGKRVLSTSPAEISLE